MRKKFFRFLKLFCFANVKLRKRILGKGFFMEKAIQAAQSDSLIERLRSGDDNAFGELVNSHWDKIYNRANSLLDNRQDAEEVAQDTFIRARKSISNFRGECSLSTWLFRIATNLAHNKHWYWWRRKRGSSVSLDCPVSEGSETTFAEVIEGEDRNPADCAATAELLEILPAAMAAIPEKYSRILKLRNELDMSYDEIAEKTGLSVGTVKSRLSRAREFLRAELAKFDR